MLAVDETYWTIQQVAEKLQVTDRTVRRWIEDGKLAAVRFSESQQGHVRITDSDLREFVERHRIRRG
jgi:excisionase family DNA binding protein